MECHANLIVTVNNLHNSVSDDTNFGKQLRIPKDICMFRTALSQSIALSRTALRLAERCSAVQLKAFNKYFAPTTFLFTGRAEFSVQSERGVDSVSQAQLQVRPHLQTQSKVNSYPYEQQLSHYNLLDLECTRVE